MSGVVIKVDAKPIRAVTDEVEEENILFCPCDFRCDFEEKVFADDGADGIKNDFTDFLFRKISSEDIIKIELLRNGVNVALINNDAYGKYYSSFDAQPLYVGWVADWTKIFDAFSGGRYQIKITKTLLGETTETLSRYFRLNTFDILAANKTVKIETVQTGKFENTGFDFTDLVEGGWRSFVRLDGTFGEMQPSIERDIYQDTSFREIQNRDTVRREYTLNAEAVPENLQNRLATVDMLANSIFLTAYDVFQNLKYIRHPVVIESFGEVRYDKLGKTFFEIVFSDRQKNIIKINV